MNKAVIGLLLGAILGALDGLSAWFTPAVRDQLFTIIVPASTGKGLVAGLVTGFIARKFQNLPLGIVVGFAVAALTSLPFALGEDEHGNSYFWHIMIPGAICGAIVGFATQRYGAGSPATPGAAATR